MDGDRLAADRAADAALVERVRAGDERAFGELYDRWIDRVHDLAWRIVGDDASDVAHDAFLAAWRNLDSLRDPAAFGGWLLRSARNAALDRLERDRRASPTDTQGFAVIESSGMSGADAPEGFRVEDRLGAAEDPARAVEDAEVVDLVWESASALGERDATVLDLTLRHGLTPAEVGEVVGVNRNAANQLVHRVRNRLGDAVRARVLWNGDDPRCSELAAALAEAGVTGFGGDAVRITSAHASRCEACDERRRLRLSPAAMFSALPLVGVPALVDERIAAALAAEGVPMEGSVALADGTQGPDASGEGGGADLDAGGPDTVALAPDTVPTGIVEAEAGDGHASIAEPVAVEEPPTIVASEAIAAPVAVGETASGDEAPSLVARHWSKIVVAAVVLALGLVVLIVGVPGGSDDGEGLAAGGLDLEALTAATLPPEPATTTTPEVEAPPAPAEGPAPSSEDAAQPPAPPTTAPVPPPPAPEITVRIDDAPLQSTYTRADAPMLVWSVVGGSAVEVSGPGMATSTARSGEEPLCPTEPPDWQVCPYVPGAWTYRVRVHDATGALLAEETVVLTRA